MTMKRNFKLLGILFIIFTLVPTITMAGSKNQKKEGNHFGWYKNNGGHNTTTNTSTNMQGQSVINSGNSNIEAGAVQNNNTITTDNNNNNSVNNHNEGNNNNMENSFTANTSREFVSPGFVQYGQLIPYMGEGKPSDAFQEIEKIIMYNVWFSRGSLVAMLKGTEDAEVELKVVNEYLIGKTPVSEDGTKWIKVYVSEDKYDGAFFLAYATGRSEHRKTTMVEVFAKTALEALDAGANVLHITTQGAVRDAEAFGWGVGVMSTQGQVYSGEGKSNVSAGGFGIAKGYAGSRDKPWIHAFALIDPNLKYPKLLK